MKKVWSNKSYFFILLRFIYHLSNYYYGFFIKPQKMNEDTYRYLMISDLQSHSY